MPLATGVTGLLWEGTAEAAGRPRVLLDDRPIPLPVSRATLPLAGGGRRHLLVLRAPAEVLRRTAVMRVVDPAGVTVAASPVLPGRDEADAAALVEGVTGVGRLRLARFALEHCPALFGLRHDGAYLRLCGELVRELQPRPGLVLPRCRLHGNGVLAEGRLSAALVNGLAVVALDRRGLVEVPAETVVGPEADTARLWLLLDPDRVPRGATLVLLGEDGLACRRLGSAGRPLPHVLEVVAAGGGRAVATRRAALALLARATEDGARARALTRELRALPRASSGPTGPALPVRAGIDLALGTGSGVFAAGWLDDPAGLVAALRLEFGARVLEVPVGGLARFPRPAPDGVGPRDASASGFALFGGGRGDLPLAVPCRVGLHLGSGRFLDLGEAPGPADPRRAAAALLAAVPRGALTPELVAAVLEPAARALDEAAPRPVIVGRRTCGVLPARPRLSLVLPVGDDPDVVRYRTALLAGDPALRNVELLHLLDRPDRAAAVERLLAGLVALYDLPSRLLVLDGPVPVPARVEVGATEGGGERLVVLGPEVVPERAGWLDQLDGLLTARPDAGIVGARLVRADDSLLHAGGAPVADDSGRVDLEVPDCGFPRSWLTGWKARRSRLVPAGCFALRRALIDAAGGWPQGYRTAEFAAAELCVAAERANLQVWVLREPTLVDLARTGDPMGLDPARELDRRLFQARFTGHSGAGEAAAPAARPGAIPMPLARPTMGEAA